MTAILRSLSAAFISLAISAPFSASASAQSGAASLAWVNFSAANPGWDAEWTAAGDQAESLRGLSVAGAGDPAAIAASFISANSAVFGLAGGAGSLKLDHQIFDGTDTHVSYQQTVGGLPVFNGFVDVHVNGSGQVYLVNNNAVSAGAARALSLAPALGESAAAAAAQAVRQTFFDKAGVPFTLALRPTGRPQLGIENTENGAHLAYRVDLGPRAYVLDANTGAVLDTVEYMLSVHVNGTASKIFDPNPVNTLNNSSLTDHADANYRALRNAYFKRTLRSITRTGSGASRRFALVGPYVRVLDLRKASVGTCMNRQHEVRKPPTKSRTATFAVNRHSNNFEFAMAYFHIDRNQRYIHSLGIINWDKAIRVDAHAITVDNSFYCGRPVGGGYLAFGDGGVDDAEEADVLLHEYGHALQDNASNGRYLGGGQAGAMGEGFGDYWAFSAKSAGRWGPCFAEWDTQGHCLRRLDKNKKFPHDYVGEVHADGEIWSRGLRDLFKKVGKNKADRIILKSHFLIPVSPNFTKGVNALIDADEALFHGANKDDICSVFLDRGIRASQCGYWIQMTWNKLDTDVDLHLRPPANVGGGVDVAYNNRNPNWGDLNSHDDDPLLYQDCIHTCTTEKITVSGLQRGTFRVIAHYYSDHGKGSTTVRIDVLRGTKRLFLGTHRLTATGQDWFAFNIVSKAAAIAPEIVEVDQVGRSPSLPVKK